MVNPEFREEKLDPANRCEALQALPHLVTKFPGCESAKAEDILSFMAHVAPFHAVVKISPIIYWKTYMVDHPLSKFALLLSSLPASQAAVERVFKSAKWQQDDRERLATNRLAIRVNARAPDVLF